MRYTDAVYEIDKRTGQITWKLGGTRTGRSLRIIGDNNVDFGGQPDVRELPDGTVTVFDDGAGRGRAPRALRFGIDPQTHTATLLEALPDPQRIGSPCCGSARRLPEGDWVVSWGGTHLISELTSAGRPVFSLQLTSGRSYRVQPILPGVITRATLTSAMGRMHPS